MSDAESPEDTEREKLNIFIALATTALRYHRAGKPLMSETHSNDVLRVLQDVVTLLTTGTPDNPDNDPYTSPVLAVTANVQQNSIDVLLVTSNTRCGRPPEEKVEVKALKTEKTGDKVLQKCFHRNLDSHYENVFSILETFHAGDGPQSSEKISDKRIAAFHCYIVNYAYYKIAARILKGQQTWLSHPLDTLAAYSLSDLQERLSFPKTLKIDKSLGKWLRDKHGIIPSPTNSSVEVTRDNIGQWIKALTGTFVALRNILIDRDACKADIGVMEVGDATTLLMTLRGLLKTGIVEFLLSDPLLAEEMGRKPHGAFVLTDTENPVPVAESDSDEDVALEERVEETQAGKVDDDVFADDLQPQRPHHPIIRYLRTIVAWTAAVESIASKSLSRRIHAHTIAVPHPIIPHIDRRIAEFKTDILQQ